MVSSKLVSDELRSLTISEEIRRCVRRRAPSRVACLVNPPNCASEHGPTTTAEKEDSVQATTARIGTRSKNTAKNYNLIFPAAAAAAASDEAIPSD